MSEPRASRAFTRVAKLAALHHGRRRPSGHRRIGRIRWPDSRRPVVRDSCAADEDQIDTAEDLMAFEAITGRLHSLLGQIRFLPPHPRRDLEPLLKRSRAALPMLRESQVLAAEQTVRHQIEQARRAG